MLRHLSQQEIDTYLDDELTDAARQDVIAHLDVCEMCRDAVESERQLKQAIRSAQPLVRPSVALRSKVDAILSVRESQSLLGRVIGKPFRKPTSIRPVLGYAAVFLLVVAIGMLWSLWRKEVRAARFVQMAIETHQRRLNGSLPIQLKSVSAREITSWFSPRLSFHFRLPTYQDDSGDRSQYELIGGSVISFEGSNTAYIAYRLGTELISLVVTSTDQATASGGEITRAKGLIFHTVNKTDVKVFTWSAHNLTYALVSNIKLPRHQSCIVCHSDPKDRVLLRGSLTHHPGPSNQHTSDPLFLKGQLWSLRSIKQVSDHYLLTDTFDVILNQRRAWVTSY